MKRKSFPTVTSQTPSSGPQKQSLLTSLLGRLLQIPAHAQERLLLGRRRAERSYSTFKVRRGSREKITLVQGKEQWLRFAGAAVKRDPTSKVRETQVRR